MAANNSSLTTERNVLLIAALGVVGFTFVYSLTLITVFLSFSVWFTFSVSGFSLFSTLLLLLARLCVYAYGAVRCCCNRMHFISVGAAERYLGKGGRETT